VAVPDQPEIDVVGDELLTAYYAISRGRQYVGMAAAPAPISISAISDYLSAYGSSVDRREFDEAIFVLDDVFRKNWEDEQDKKKTKDK
jgi:hypothetical protein